MTTVDENNIMNISQTMKRLECKQDSMQKSLTDFVTSMNKIGVQFEESIKYNERHMLEQKESMSKLTDRVRALEAQSNQQQAVNRFLYVIGTAAATALVGVIAEFLTR